MGSVTELDAKWRDAVEGMKFFDEPVQDMDAESLLRVIGYLVIENRRLKKDAAVLLETLRHVPGVHVLRAGDDAGSGEKHE